MNPKLIELFQKMYEHTEPECRLNCRCPQSCCSPEYCDMADQYMRENKVLCEYTTHPRLKYMGPTGCIVPPHFRPLCTLHVCSINAWGEKLGDADWTNKYYTIRQDIETEMFNDTLSR